MPRRGSRRASRAPDGALRHPTHLDTLADEIHGPMLYEIHITRLDGTTAKESFTAVNDKKAIQRIDSALERHAGPDAGGTYKLVDGRGRDVVREADIPKRA